MGKICMRLDQSVGFAAIDLFLQLNQDILLVGKEGVDDLLGIRSTSDTARKKVEVAIVFANNSS